MKILGVGYPRTGTRSLVEALRTLGFQAVHHLEARHIPLHPPRSVDWRAYDTIEAVVDITGILFWCELAEAYPDAKVILTIRDPDTWYESNIAHAAYNRERFGRSMQEWSDKLGCLLFGTASENRYWWIRRYREHIEAVVREIPAPRLLVMNIIEGEGWEVLCDFLGVPVPDAPWPHENKRGPQTC